MTDLETYKNQDELYFALNSQSIAIIIISSVFMLFLAWQVIVSGMAQQYPMYYLFSVFLAAGAISSITFHLKKPENKTKKPGLYIDKQGLEMVDVGFWALKLNWNEIEKIVLRRQRNLHYVCFHIKNKSSPKMKPKGFMGRTNAQMLGTPLFLGAIRIKIQRDDLYPLIMHFWEKHKNL